MSRRDARLTPLGRLLLVERIRAGMPVAHAAKAMGVSRQCAYKWLRRFGAEGHDGLRDRSSRSLSCARQTPAAVEEAVTAARLRHRRGPGGLAWRTGVPARTVTAIPRRRGSGGLAWRTGVPARTVTAIPRRRGLPGLRDLDPMTGALIRSSKAAAVRYERDRPGELAHLDVKKADVKKADVKKADVKKADVKKADVKKADVKKADVKKPGRIPDGGGWRAHGRAAAPRGTGGGFDFTLRGG